LERAGGGLEVPSGRGGGDSYSDAVEAARAREGVAAIEVGAVAVESGRGCDV
jgi:hypothetical protein